MGHQKCFGTLDGGLLSVHVSGWPCSLLWVFPGLWEPEMLGTLMVACFQSMFLAVAYFGCFQSCGTPEPLWDFDGAFGAHYQSFTWEIQLNTASQLSDPLA